MVKNICIILNYNDSETTINLLEKIKNFKCIYKIIIVDNKSTDNSFFELKKYESQKIEVIVSDKNGGYGYGNNFGVRYANLKYDYENLIICNPDIDIEEEVMENLLSKIDDKVSAISGLMLDSKKEIINITAWKLPSYRDILRISLIILKKTLKNRTLYNINRNSGLQKVEVLPGSLLIFNKEVFDEVNGFDEDTFLYHEENIIFYKIKERGYSTYLDTDVCYIHNHQVSINKSMKNDIDRMLINMDSAQVYLEKCLKINQAQLYLYRLLRQVAKIEMNTKNIIKGWIK